MALADNLISYYKLESDATDSTGLCNGSSTGVSYQAGKLGNGAKFPGTSSNVITVANTYPHIANPSVFMWVKPTNLASTEKYFTRDQGGTTNWGFIVSQDSTNVYQVGVQTTVAFRTLNSTTAVSTSAFIFLGFTYDGSNLRLWINGVNETTLLINEGMIDTNSKTWYIGCLNPTTQTTAALVDEVSVWNKALSNYEVSRLYNSGAGYNSYPFKDRGFIMNTLRPRVFSPGNAR